MVATAAPRVAVPTLEEKAATLVEHVELVGRSASRGVAVWWCPSWSGAADAAGDAFHVVMRVGAPAEGAAQWYCDCEHGAHHPGTAACSHVRAVRLWLERRKGR